MVWRETEPNNKFAIGESHNTNKTKYNLLYPIIAIYNYESEKEGHLRFDVGDAFNLIYVTKGTVSTINYFNGIK